MRKTVIFLCVVAAALSADPEPPAAPAQTTRLEPVQSPAALAPPAPHPEAAERQDTVNKLEPVESGAATDDLKPEATFWGGYGWGYRPRYYGYYKPRYYAVPYWGGYGWRGGYGWNGGHWG